MIKIINGNLISLAKNSDFDVIIHGCNCFGADSQKGISKKIFEAFPEARIADSKTAKGDVYKLGDYSYCYIKSLRLTIVNLYTQYEPGLNFEYTALGLALRNLANALNGDEIIGMPLIGAGVNRGNSEQILEIIKTELDSFNVTIIKETI
jgi:O-acetyl-ADP-ribose deacetylase (regulator of RNase III)